MNSSRSGSGIGKIRGNGSSLYRCDVPRGRFYYGGLCGGRRSSFVSIRSFDSLGRCGELGRGLEARTNVSCLLTGKPRECLFILLIARGGANFA